MEQVQVMVKPVSGSCNMRCRYCFYHDISQQRQVKNYGVMSHAVLEQVVRRVTQAAHCGCGFAFQGGEPTLAGLDFFRALVQLQERYAGPKGLMVHNAIQTNGLALDAHWAAFFKEHRFLVGLSVDGTRDLHDALRPDEQGAGTYARVVRAAQLLQRYGVEFNILTVVTQQSARAAQRMYHQYDKNGWNHLQFIPCLDPSGHSGDKHPWSLSPQGYGTFLKTLFDSWYRDLQRGKHVYIRFFDNLLGLAAGVQPESCSQLGHCPPQLVVEADGSVYPCDFYVTDPWRCGDMTHHTVSQLLDSPAARRFRMESVRPEPACQTCRWGALCRGGCRRDRDSGGTLGRSSLCQAYQDFFPYAYNRLLQAARFVQQGL